MSNKTNKELTVTLEGFGGIDATASHSDLGRTEDLLNFRILKDGALEKRCGFRYLTDLGIPVLACWSGVIQGSFRCYLVSRKAVWTLDVAKRERKLVGEFPTEITHACFFFYRGALYLMSNTTIWEIQSNTLVEQTGYVPLIATYANNREEPELHEARNILTRRARMEYVISDPVSIFLPVGENVESVDKVFINGELIDSSRYYFDPNFLTINVLEMNAGDHVTVYFTYAEGYEEERASLFACTDAVLFGSFDRNRLFLWGNDAPGQMFCSSYVEKENVAQSERGYTNGGPLYFPAGYEFTVGGGRCRIQGAEKHFDRLMIFTEGEVWIASEGSTGLDEFPTANVNARLGCASTRGVTLADNDPISVGYGTVWKWTGESERLSERNATRLSEAIDPLLTADDYATMGVFFDRTRNELWLNVKTRKEAWVYHLRYKKWYRFGQISADTFFDAGGVPGFIKDGKVFVFDESLRYDLTTATYQSPISAEYLSPPLDFGTEKRKNLTGVTLRGDLDSAYITITFSGRGTDAVSRKVADVNQDHSIIRRRMSSGGFRYGQARLTTTGQTRPIIHSLTLRAR